MVVDGPRTRGEAKEHRGSLVRSGDCVCVVAGVRLLREAGGMREAGVWLGEWCKSKFGRGRSSKASPRQTRDTPQTTRCPRGATGGVGEFCSRGTGRAINWRAVQLSMHASEGVEARSKSKGWMFLWCVVLAAVRLKNGGAASPSNRRPSRLAAKPPPLGSLLGRVCLAATLEVPRWPVRSFFAH